MVSKLGFSGEYVEKMTPTERVLYFSYYEKEQEEAKKKEKGQPEGMVIDNRNG
jgi:hypothetical protein